VRDARGVRPDVSGAKEGASTFERSPELIRRARSTRDHVNVIFKCHAFSPPQGRQPDRSSQVERVARQAKIKNLRLVYET